MSDTYLWAIQAPVNWSFRTCILRFGFEHKVEGRLGGAAEAGESAFGHDFAHPRLARLRPQGQSDLLRERCGSADQRRGRVEQPPDRIEVVLHAVIGVMNPYIHLITAPGKKRVSGVLLGH